MAELSVVLVIVGLIGTSAVLNWKALLPSQKLQSAVRKLSDVMHECRSESISRNRVFELYYDLENNRYWTKTPYRQDGGGLVRSEEEKSLVVNDTPLDEHDIEIVSVTIDDETYTDGTVFVRFQPLGASSSHLVVLHQPLLESYFTIEMMPLTGDMRFHDGVFERVPADDKDFD